MMGAQQRSILATGVWVMAVFCFTLIFIPATGTWKVNTEVDPIEVLFGEDVTLPCLLSGITKPLNLKIVGVYWTRKSQDGTTKVYQFEGYNHTQIRPASNMRDNDLLLGNASLYLPHVRISDEGLYRCRVIVSPNAADTTYTLLVSGKPLVILTDSVSVSVGNEKSVTCNLTQFYPKDVKIQWIMHRKHNGRNSSLDEDTYFTIPAENSDGTFSVSSILNVRPSSTEETGDEYFCIVSHRSLKTNIERSFTLTVTASNDQSLIIGLIIVSILLVVFSIAMLVWLLFKRARYQLCMKMIVILLVIIISPVIIITITVVILKSRQISSLASSQLVLIFGALLLSAAVNLAIAIMWMLRIKKNLNMLMTSLNHPTSCSDVVTDDSKHYSKEHLHNAIYAQSTVGSSKASECNQGGSETIRLYRVTPADSERISTQLTVTPNAD